MTKFCDLLGVDKPKTRVGQAVNVIRYKISGYIVLIKLFNCSVLPFTPRLTYLPDIYQQAPRHFIYFVTKIKFRLEVVSAANGSEISRTRLGKINSS